MKLAKGKGSPEEGGCWMALNDYYARGVLDWTDQPDCVDSIIRPLAILLNDMCEDGERELLIGPHVWTTMGTKSDELLPARLEKVVRLGLDCVAEVLDDERIEHDLWTDFGRDYITAKSAVMTAALHVKYRTTSVNGLMRMTLQLIDFAKKANCGDASKAVCSIILSRATRRITLAKEKLLNFILELCAMSTPKEIIGAVSKEEALKVVCKTDG